MLVEYQIPEALVFEIQGLPRPRYFVVLGRGIADIATRERRKQPFYVVPFGEWRGIYND